MSQVIERYALIFNEKWAGLTINIVQLVAEFLSKYLLMNYWALVAGYATRPSSPHWEHDLFDNLSADDRGQASKSSHGK